jgi:hypothetical protein
MTSRPFVIYTEGMSIEGRSLIHGLSLGIVPVVTELASFNTHVTFHRSETRFQRAVLRGGGTFLTSLLLATLFHTEDVDFRTIFTGSLLIAFGFGAAEQVVRALKAREIDRAFHRP